MRKLIRPERGRLVAGVCKGLAQYFNIDATIIRVLFLVLFIMGAVPGLLLYFLLWVIIPSEKSFLRA